MDEKTRQTAAAVASDRYGQGIGNAIPQ